MLAAPVKHKGHSKPETNSRRKRAAVSDTSGYWPGAIVPYVATSVFCKFF